jgi:predicted transcriptional regulator YdeE
MEVRIVEKDQMLLVGLSFFGDPFQSSAGWTEENEIGRLWVRFMAFLENQGARIQHIKEHEVSYEVHIEHAETQEKGEYEVFVGLEVAQLQDLPVELLVKVLPPTTYAIFTLAGEEITSDWHQMIHRDWLPELGYRIAYDYAIERYDPRFKGLDRIAESVLEVYIPVADDGS